MARVAVDVDSTLYDFETPMRQAFLDLALEKGDKETYFRGGYHSWVEWRSVADVCGIDAFMEALARVHSDEVILSRPPFDHSVEVLNQLAEEHEIIYVTHRKPGSGDATYRWLMERGFPGSTLIITGNSKSSALSNCQYLIDDRPRTLVEFIYDHYWGLDYPDEERKAFGLLYEYNRTLTDIPNVYLAPTWLGLKYYLQEKGVMSERLGVS